MRRAAAVVEAETANGAASPRRRRFTTLAAVVAWGGILLQLYLSLRLAAASGKSPGEGLLVYFGYFTILTNILAAAALTAATGRGRSPPSRFLCRPGVVTAIAAAILLVGLAYFFLLRRTWAPEGWQFAADALLHYVTPDLFIAYWWRAVPKHGLRWRDVTVWSPYPLGFFAYALLRGELTGLYPYPFIDAATIGYGRTLLNAAGILAGFVALALLLVAIGRGAARRIATAPAGRPPASA